ncbi:MAG TPA: UDP-N-acetylmuramate--L-alanine ligase [Gemmatimonadales bacterium]|nr:UDP-N-acetylmuramate--L-alanine ligase [Gemmatimonadales bacterium]
MPLFTPEDPRPIHFMGVAGAGVSALALIARRRGVAVSGCDADPAGAADVEAAGAQIYRGHDPAHVAGTRAVIYTAAVPPDHAELLAARAAGVPVIRRADALHLAVHGGTVVAIAGTHGKTTTTVMTTEAFAAAGRHPTGIAGGRVAGWGGNARLGGDDLFVVEADEYDRALLSLRPSVAVVGNVEADHLECYGSVAALEAAFAEFAGHGGIALFGADDAGARRVAAAVSGERWLVGLAQDADVRVERVRQESATTEADVVFVGGLRIPLRLQVPGLHNVRNAAMALAAVRALGGDVERASAALAAFSGVSRRFEWVGSARGVTVVDDYAHHPSEVAATLAAARQRYPGRRVVAVFQPHLYTRTQLHGDALGIALAAADRVVVTEIYAAREEPIAGVSGSRVARAAKRSGAEVEWVPDRRALAGSVAALVQPGDVVLTLGAGDITHVARELLDRLQGKAA